MKKKLEVTKNQLKKAIRFIEENAYLNNADFHGCKITNVKIRTAKLSGIDYDIGVDRIKDDDKVVLYTGKLFFEKQSQIYNDCYFTLDFLIDIIKRLKIKE